VSEDGVVVGRHSGVHNFTIGPAQKGLGVSRPVSRSMWSPLTVRIIGLWWEMTNLCAPRRVKCRDVNWISLQVSE